MKTNGSLRDGLWKGDRASDEAREKDGLESPGGRLQDGSVKKRKENILLESYKHLATVGIRFAVMFVCLDSLIHSLIYYLPSVFVLYFITMSFART